MNKQELIRTLGKDDNGKSVAFLNVSQVAEKLGRSRDFVRENILSGMECVQIGTNRMYFVNDIAQRLIDLRTM